MAKTVLITGCSSGIGYESVKYFQEKGWNVVATMRNTSCGAGEEFGTLKNVLVIKLDVIDRVTIDNAVQAGITRFGFIDALVNNAGFAILGPFELATEDMLLSQYNTNLMGPVRVMQAVLPLMRKRRRGVIVNVSSVGGKVTMPFLSLYQSTKFGLEGLSECAAMELAPFGIKVRIVEPGIVNTKLHENVVRSVSSSITCYDKLMDNLHEAIPALVATGSEPVVSAQVIYKAVTDEGDCLRYVAGEDAEKMLSQRAAVSDEEHIKLTNELLLKA